MASTALFTTPVAPNEVGDPRIALTAHFLQEWVPKHHDVRVTVVGQEVFAVVIDVQGSDAGIVDWRADYASHRYHPTSIPDEVRRGLTAMLERLGLSFGVIDFVVRIDGAWVFLELNPNGQWGWIEEATDLPISSSIASELQRGNDDAG